MKLIAAIHRRSVFWGLMVCILTSCSGNDDTVGETTIDDGISTVIRDLPGDTNGAMGEEVDGKTRQGFHTFLFRLSDQKQIWLRNEADSARWMKTLEWDLAFTGPYNSEVFVNKGSYKFNPGSGGPADSAIILVEKPYDEVDEAPSDETFESSTINKIGWASDQYEVGWFFYSLDTHIMIPIKNRTYVIRLPDGLYAKLELINAYQGNPPEVTNMNWPAPYFTFRYHVQEDGTKNLKTR